MKKDMKFKLTKEQIDYWKEKSRQTDNLIKNIIETLQEKKGTVKIDDIDYHYDGDKKISYRMKGTNDKIEYTKVGDVWFGQMCTMKSIDINPWKPHGTLNR